MASYDHPTTTNDISANRLPQGKASVDRRVPNLGPHVPNWAVWGLTLRFWTLGIGADKRLQTARVSLQLEVGAYVVIAM